MYTKIYSMEDKKNVSIFSKKGRDILLNYLNIMNGGADTKTSSEEENINMDQLLELDFNTRVLRSFEQNYKNSFWVSCHGVYENDDVFRVPVGCKLIFTTWLGKLGEGDNYQENETFRDLQAKNSLQFIEVGALENKDKSVLPELLQKDNIWGRGDGTLFSERIIYNEGDHCPNLHMIMDGDCWKQGFYLIPIKKNDNYFVEDISDEDLGIDCDIVNKNTADYYWRTKKYNIFENINRGAIKKIHEGASSSSSTLILGDAVNARIGTNKKYHKGIITAIKSNKSNNTYTIKFDKKQEGVDPGWESHISKRLGNILGISTSRSDLFSEGHSDSILSQVSERWGAQRNLGNVLAELTNSGIRGCFIIGLCRPDDISGSTYYDDDNPRTLLSNDVELTASDYEAIIAIEQKQRDKNAKYQEIYNSIKSDEQRILINSLKSRPDAVFLEQIPHFESDTSLQKYITIIAKILYNDDTKEVSDWLENLLENLFEHVTPPINKPERDVESITGRHKLSGVDKRHSRYLLRQGSSNTVQILESSLQIEEQRRRQYIQFISEKWGQIKARVDSLLTKSLSTVIRIAKSKNIELKDEYDEDEEDDDEVDDVDDDEDDDDDDMPELVEETINDINLDRLTKQRLIETANKFNIDIDSSKNKSDILESLEKAQETDKGIFQLAVEIAISESDFN
jgi:hypothetical protein